MARFVTGNDFNTGDQVTADKLNNAVNNAKASTDSVDNSSIAVDGSGVLSVKTSTSASDGVTFAKFQKVPANTVLVRDANSLGSISAKAVADTQILIGDGTGFTSAALSGDVTMTNAGAVTIANDAVTGDKISDSAALPDGVTATTQSANNNSTKVATTAYVDTAALDPTRTYESLSLGTTSGTIYQNTSGRPLYIQFSMFSNNDINFLLFDLSANSDMSGHSRIAQTRIISDSTGDSGGFVSGIVPANFYYQISYTASSAEQLFHTSFKL